jgi:hypothetical protein
MNRIFQFFSLLWIVWILVGCGAPDPTPTATPSPEPVFEAGEVILDGDNCTVTVPNELPAGWYAISFTNLTEGDYDLLVGRFEEGKTYQDLLDAQSEPGEFVQQENFYSWPRQPSSAQLMSDGSKVHTFHLSREGEYFIYFWSWRTETTPHPMWLCKPFWVTGNSTN